MVASELANSDLTYVAMAHGFMYPVAIRDWFSRRVLAGELSNTMDLSFCGRDRAP